MFDYFDDSKYNEECEKLKHFKSICETNDLKFKKTNFDDLKPKDFIYIEFYPYSQKNIYSLYPIFGVIKEIKPLIPTISSSNEQLQDLTIERLILTSIFDNLENNTHQGYHNWTSYFGNSRGYDYTIYKLKQNFDYYISSPENTDTDTDVIIDDTLDKNLDKNLDKKSYDILSNDDLTDDLRPSKKIKL